MQSLLTVPPAMGYVDKCNNVSILVLTHQQVKLVQICHDDRSGTDYRMTLGSAPASRV